jgi:hypothetical protein
MAILRQSAGGRTLGNSGAGRTTARWESAAPSGRASPRRAAGRGAAVAGLGRRNGARSRVAVGKSYDGSRVARKITGNNLNPKEKRRRHQAC